LLPPPALAPNNTPPAPARRQRQPRCRPERGRAMGIRESRPVFGSASYSLNSATTALRIRWGQLFCFVLNDLLKRNWKILSKLLCKYYVPILPVFTGWPHIETNC